MPTDSQQPTTPNHLRSWSVVDSEELRLLREFEHEIVLKLGISGRAIAILDQLLTLREQLKR